MYRKEVQKVKEIISIINRKGGVGKTATAHALGAGLSLKGFKVLYIDLDSQCNLTYSVGARSNGLTSMELLTGTATAEEAIQHTEQGDIIPASPSLSGADQTITKTGKEHRLEEALKPLKSKYDYIVIDTPPALGILTVNALTASNSAIIPAEADTHSLQGIGLLQEEIEAVQAYCNKELTVKGILITRYSGRAVLSRDMKDNLETVAKQFNSKVFSIPVRECIAIKEAYTVQQDIYSYAPKSNASTDYKAFIEEVLQ